MTKLPAKPSSKSRSASSRRAAAERAPRHEPLTRFLNVDLEVWSRAGLDELVAAFGGHNLHNGKTPRGYLASFEVQVRGHGVESIVRALVKRANALEGSARSLWERAMRRDFNIGIQAGEGPHSYELALSPAALASIAAIGGRLVVTVYGSKTERPAPSLPRRAGEPRPGRRG